MSPWETPTLSDRLTGETIVLDEHDLPSLTVLTGERIGAMLRLAQRSAVVGCGGDVDWSFADPSLSLHHARFFRVQDDFYVQDLASSNGTTVAGRAIHGALRLCDGDQVQLGPHVVLQFNMFTESEESAAISLYEASVRDATTGAYNRRHLDRSLVAEKAFAESSGAPLALLLLDIDAFKLINDSHGHLVGDSVLSVVAASVQRLLRPQDTLARFGGDEFVVICRDTTLRNGRILAERARAAIAKLQFSAVGNDFHITVSVGVSGGCSDEHGWSTLVQSADRAMYQAKRDGRNVVR